MIDANLAQYDTVVMMNRLLFMVTLTAAVGQNGPPASWRVWAYPNLGFTVKLPGTPKEKKQQWELPEGKVEATTRSYDGLKDGVLVVGVTQFPAGAGDGGEEKRLKNARDGALASAKGKL
ncbi:MAG: hypothetical protein NZO58_05315, partial [Gemmataceae bacterium]|nr:hypothetical protein [Gemmataceae bacterium]